MIPLPSDFRRFSETTEAILRLNPKAIAIVGSHANEDKCADCLSDYDLIFVFDDASTLSVVRRAQEACKQIAGLITLYLGVHPQFGHLLSAHFTDDPLRWIDIGIMDVRFAEEYLTALPMRTVRGNILTCGIPPSPLDQMHHIAKKLLKARRRANQQRALCYCYRYLEWADKQFEEPYNATAVRQFVLRDIRQRFPDLADEAKDDMGDTDALAL